MLGKDPKFVPDTFPEELRRYLERTLHDGFRVNVFADTAHLPVFLRQAYRFYEATVAGKRCIFVAAAEKTATPADIAKHVALVRSKVDATVIFATPALSAYNRSRLLDHGVAFVVPGNQLYIPELAMDLRERFRAPKLSRADGLSPVAQAVLFHHLLRLDEDATFPSLIAVRLHYSSMSISRAFDDLAARGLAETERRGKERHLRFTAGRRVLLETARDLLRSPVRSLKFIRGGCVGPPLKQAGETALAELTNLSRPRVETYAVAAGGWKAVPETLKLDEVDEQDAGCIVETWSYDPAGLSAGPVVDPLSLYAQFHNHQDERVAAAAEKLLKKVPW